MGLKEARRETEARGASPRRDEVDDLRVRPGVEERKLATLGLRWSEGVALKLGVEGARRGGVGLRAAGECGCGCGWGSGMLVAVCRERRFSGSERRFASLFVVVCLAGRGGEGAAAGLGCRWLCILALGGRVAGPGLPRWRRRRLSLWQMSGGEEEATGAMTEEQGRVALPATQARPSPACA